MLNEIQLGNYLVGNQPWKFFTVKKNEAIYCISNEYSLWSILDNCQIIKKKLITGVLGAV